jgi:RNA polymerase sigma-70 factor (ECF subfamily)
MFGLFRRPPQDAAAAQRKLRLRRIFDDSYQQAWRVLKRLGVPAERLDDAVQQVFLITAERLDDIEAGRERAFVYGVALHHARTILRRSWREVLGDETDARPGGAPSPEVQLDQKRCIQLCHEALDSMSDDLRETFVLYELEGFTMEEIAALGGIPRGTVASRLRRARQLFEERSAEWAKSYSVARERS